MILYRKVCGGICLVFRPSGAVLRAFVPGTLAAAWGVCLELWARDLLGADLKHAFHHPYPYQIFTLVFGFLLVFRTNFAYHRYWNASTFVTQMHSKWGDAVLSLLSFDAMNADQDAARAAARREFRLRFVHLFSLLSAVALAQLRFDRNLANLDPDEHDAGEASGGYAAELQVDGTVRPGSQQQWLTVASKLGQWDGGLWNMVFLGVEGAPAVERPPLSRSPPGEPWSPSGGPISSTAVDDFDEQHPMPARRETLSRRSRTARASHTARRPGRMETDAFANAATPNVF